MMHHQELIALIKAAVECSVYIEPTDPGLTYPELVEVCTQAGYQDGEIGDAFRQSGITRYFGPHRLFPHDHTKTMWALYNFDEEPDYRNFAAMDYVVSELNALAKKVGAGQARLDRSVLVERAKYAGLPERDVEAAITVMVMSDRLAEKDGIISIPRGREGRGLPGEERNAAPRSRSTPKPARERAYPLVADVISRRRDGRPKHAEPFDAFADQLTPLGYDGFRLWWTQTVAELRRADPQASSLSVAVLSAALAEGALTFLVRHARSMSLGPFGSTDFDRPPTSWKIDDLVASAAMGKGNAVLDESARHRAASLIRTRQRIHAGRMLVEFPKGVPDLRPEEARDARATAEIVVRSVIDWLMQHPPLPDRARPPRIV